MSKFFDIPTLSKLEIPSLYTVELIYKFYKMLQKKCILTKTHLLYKVLDKEYLITANIHSNETLFIYFSDYELTSTRTIFIIHYSLNKLHIKFEHRAGLNFFNLHSCYNIKCIGVEDDILTSTLLNLSPEERFFHTLNSSIYTNWILDGNDMLKEHNETNFAGIVFYIIDPNIDIVLKTITDELSLLEDMKHD